MSDKKISALTSAVTPLGGTEVLPIVQSGTTVKVSVDNLTAGKNVTAVNFGAGLAPGTAGDEKYFRAGLYSLYGQRASASQDLSASWNAYIDSVDTSGNGYKYRVTGDLASAYEQNGAHRWYVAPSGTAGTAVSFTQALTIATNANVTVNAGNLVVGTAGKGIDFSANANAPGMTSEVLTWYEEGTWTPATFTNWSTAPTSILSAKYTRIGRLVTLNVLGYEGAIAGSGAIGGLPFAVDTSGGSLIIQDVAGAGVTSFGIVEGGSSRISGLTAANYTGKYWHFSCSYVV